MQANSKEPISEFSKRKIKMFEKVAKNMESKSKMTYKELANSLGVSTKTIQRIKKEIISSKESGTTISFCHKSKGDKRFQKYSDQKILEIWEQYFDLKRTVVAQKSKIGFKTFYYLNSKADWPSFSTCLRRGLKQGFYSKRTIKNKKNLH